MESGIFRKFLHARREWTCPSAWRIGPNPFLTALAVLGASGELLVLFIRKPVDYLNNEFLAICMVTGVLWLWLTMVWLLWFFLRTIEQSKLRRTLKRLVYFLVSFGLVLCAIGYSVAWFTFLYSGIFPSSEAIGLVKSGSQTDLNFILFVVDQTVPHAFLYLAVFCCVLALGVPFGVLAALRSKWNSHAAPRHFSAILTWAITGFATLFFLALMTADWNPERFQNHMTRLATQLNPIVSLTAGAVNANAVEEISPDLDLKSLTPIKPGTQLTTAPRSSGPMPSVLYLAIESLRYDVLFAKVNGIEIMPNLNALARRSVQFTQGYSTSTHTDYALPSYLSSLYPLRSQHHHNSRRNSPYPKELIYDVLKPYGYATGIITSDSTGWCNMIDFMWSRDLNVFYDAGNLPPVFVNESQNPGYVVENDGNYEPGAGTSDDAETISYAMDWLRTKINSDQPWFLHTFFQQTHFSYSVPDGAPKPFQPCTIDFPATFDAYPSSKVDVMRNAYFNAAHYVDLQLGRLLTFLEEQGQMDNTIIVLCGDHGEAFLDHNFITHSRPPYQAFIHVPMMIYAPNLAPARIAYPTELIDMPPTLCGLLGIPKPPSYQGIDVLADIRPALNDRYLFSHAEVPFGKGEAVIYAGRWKYLSDRRRNAGYLFDLKNDPGELNDIKKANPRMAARLRESLSRWRSNQLAYYNYNMYYEFYYPPKP